VQKAAEEMHRKKGQWTEERENMAIGRKRKREMKKGRGTFKERACWKEV
jgi:hypothetical protein